MSIKSLIQGERDTRRKLALLFAIVALIAVASWPATADHASSNGNFEIDANANLDPNTDGVATTDDWKTPAVLTASRNLTNDPATSPNGTCNQTGGSAFIFCDAVKDDPTTFPGGSKEKDTSSWPPIDDGQVTPKTDITNVYALARVVPYGTPATNHVVILNGMERLPKSGDVHFSFELSQATKTVDGFTVPDRRAGDVQVAYDMGGSRNSNLGSLKVRVFKAVKDNPACVSNCAGHFNYDSPDVDIEGTSFPLDDEGVIASMNTEPVPAGAWQSYDDQYNLVNTVDTFGFAEAAIDLTAALGTSDVCFANITVKSRAAESVTSQPKDTTGTVPFGFCGGVNGFKFKDVNGNGTREANGADGNPGGGDDETGLGGFTFDLYVDADSSGTMNGTESAIATATSCGTGTGIPACAGTDPTGTFKFSGVTTGTYRVHERTPPTGWSKTTTPDPQVSVSAGGTASVEFGNTPLSNITVTFANQAVIPGTTTAATQATIGCVKSGTTTPQIGSQSGNTYTATGQKIGVYTCTVTITDP